MKLEKIKWNRLNKIKQQWGCQLTIVLSYLILLDEPRDISVIGLKEIKHLPGSHYCEY